LKTRIIIITAIFLIIGYGLLRGWANLGTWLAKADGPRPSEVIVCLSDVERLKKTAELYHQGLAPRIIMTAQKDKKSLTRLGVPEDRITLVPNPKSTYEEALGIAPILRDKNYHSALVVTDPFHLRRVRWTFYQVFKDQPIQFLFVSSDLPFVRDRWWKDKKSRYYVLSEISKLAYYQIIHGILRIDQDPAWVEGLKQRFEKKFLKSAEKSAKDEGNSKTNLR
jgi:uncharacterized SAM-binding protein YcdF (DUF218 family)